MKERPILMSAPMVRAILEGRKTQTRRAVKPQPDASANLGFLIQTPNASGSCAHFHHVDERGIHSKELTVHCPYGMPGDRLWVRETWQGPLIDEELEEEFSQSPDYFKKPSFCAYRATDTLDAINADGEELGWRPSIHMPRWASRITLEITGVRVDRLNDISKADAIAEGLQHAHSGWWSGTDGQAAPTPQTAYSLLWESLAGHGSWDANPWVWVIEFNHLKQESNNGIRQ